jgi:hypothetical protein
MFIHVAVLVKHPVYLRFEVSVAVKISIVVLWIMTQCRLLSNYQNFTARVEDEYIMFLQNGSYHL